MLFVVLSSVAAQEGGMGGNASKLEALPQSNLPPRTKMAKISHFNFRIFHLWGPPPQKKPDAATAPFLGVKLAGLGVYFC